MNPQLPGSYVAHHNLSPHLYSRYKKVLSKKVMGAQQISDQDCIKTGDKLMTKRMLISVLLFILICIIAFVVLSCTISFQNIDTHGTATDLIDENMSADADISPNIETPILDVP